MTEAEKKYGDIIDMPHPTSATRPRMSREARAAQFSPFAALVGYDAAVAEAGRLTDEKITLTEEAKTLINEKINILLEYIEEHPTATVTCFIPDKKKSGGRYDTLTGEVEKIDGYERCLILSGGVKIPVEDIFDIECELFSSFSEA